MGNSKSNVASTSPNRVRFRLEGVNSLTNTDVNRANTQGTESFSARSALENDGPHRQHCEQQNQRCNKHVASPHSTILPIGFIGLIALIALVPVAPAALP
jgi:hypothetical protein